MIEQTVTASANAAQRPTPTDLEVAGVRVINCNGCHANKPETEFSFKNKATGRRNTKCKPCMRAYAQANYEANKEKRIASANRRNAAVRAQVRADLRALLADVLCFACSMPPAEGNDLIVVLPGDENTGGQSLSQVIQRGWAPGRVRALVAEAVANGEVLCRRCLGKRCGAQNQQSVAARVRALAAA